MWALVLSFISSPDKRLIIFIHGLYCIYTKFLGFYIVYMQTFLGFISTVQTNEFYMFSATRFCVSGCSFITLFAFYPSWLCICVYVCCVCVHIYSFIIILERQYISSQQSLFTLHLDFISCFMRPICYTLSLNIRYYPSTIVRI